MQTPITLIGLPLGISENTPGRAALFLETIAGNAVSKIAGDIRSKEKRQVVEVKWEQARLLEFDE